MVQKASKYSDGNEWTCHDVCMNVHNFMCGRCPKQYRCERNHKQISTCIVKKLNE